MTRSSPFLAVLALAWLIAGAAHAQTTGKVLTPCGSASFTAGTAQYPTMDPSGTLCTGGGNAQVATQLTVQNAAYSAGNAEGGLQTIAVARANGGSAILTNFGLQSKGGSTNTLSLYLFSKNPSGSTCTDKTAFVLAAADRPFLVGGAPITMTLATINSATGDTASYAILQNQTLNFVNQDATASKNLYACLVTATSVTPASTTDLIFTLGGVQ